VARRKPYRSKERIDTTAVTALHVTSSVHYPVGTRLVGRVIDVSCAGIDFTSESPLALGDRLRVDTLVEGVTIHGEATVGQTATAAFGRARAGRQFTRLPLVTQHALEALTARKAA
jgi:hypothetical protein